MDQKVPNKKPLVVIPKYSPSDQDIKQTPPKKDLVLKPENEEPLEVKTEPESVKKCLAHITKYECQSNTLNISRPIDGKDLEKGNYCEKEISEFDSIKSRIKLDYSHFGLVLLYFNKI